MELKIVRATRGDVALVTDILNRSFYKDFLRYGHCPGYNRSEEKTLNMIDFGHTYIAYFEEIAVASISVNPGEEQDEYIINGLVVVPEMQGKGIGKKLMTYGEQAVNAAVIKLTTPVDKEENLKFYTGFGYKEIDRAVDVDNPIVVFAKYFKK